MFSFATDGWLVDASCAQALFSFSSDVCPRPLPQTAHARVVQDWILEDTILLSLSTYLEILMTVDKVEVSSALLINLTKEQILINETNKK